MDQRIESFLGDGLALAGEEPDAARDGARVALAKCEAIFRLQEPKKRMRDQAAHACRAECVDSVAQFVGRRKLRAGMDGRRAGASAAARSGRGARRGRAARSGSAARSIATRVRAGGYVAERGGHFLLADNAGSGEWRAICRAATTQRLLW